MLESFSHIELQQYWWIIISVLGGLLVFLLFVQGGQTLIYSLGKTESERTLLVNALGRKWEFTFTTLVTFGGAFFASFPLFYSTSFGGAYWVWIIILFAFVIQAISYEFRSKQANFLGKKTYEVFLFINGAVGSTLLGIVVATLFTGAKFSMDLQNLTDIQSGSLPIISSWETPYHGLESVLNIQNIALGLAVFFLARVLGILYFMKNIDNTRIIGRTKKCLLINAIPFVVFFLLFTVLLFLSEGFAVNPINKVVSMEKYKYLHNLVQMPFISVLFLLGVLSVLWGIAGSIVKKTQNGIWYTGAGTFFVVFSLFIIAGFNNTAFYPSTFNLQSSLTIQNSSSSHYTLTVMSYVSILIPFVIAYIWWAWRAMNKKKIDITELNEDIHVY